MLDDFNYIEQYVRFRFNNNTDVDMPDIWFSNTEVLGDIQETESIELATETSLSGVSYQSHSPIPREWVFTINMYERETFGKFRQLIANLDTAPVLAVRLPEYFLTNPLDAYDVVKSPQEMTNASVVFSAQYRDIARGLGIVRKKEVPIIVRESAILEVPTGGDIIITGGGGGVITL